MLNIQKHVAEIPPERPDISQYPSDAWDYCSGRKTWLIQNRLGQEKTMAGPVERPPGPPQQKKDGGALAVRAPIRSPEPGALRRRGQLDAPQLLDQQGLVLGLAWEQALPSYTA